MHQYGSKASPFTTLGDSTTSFDPSFASYSGPCSNADLVYAFASSYPTARTGTGRSLTLSPGSFGVSSYRVALEFPLTFILYSR